MNICVAYHSRTGNTKIVAEAIAQALHTAAWDIAEIKDLNCDLLILGGAVYAAGLDKKLTAFLKGLNGTSAKRAVLFGTSAGGKKPFGMMKRLLKDKGIPADDRVLWIPGSWWVLHKGRPNEDDLRLAKEWAESLMQ